MDISLQLDAEHQRTVLTAQPGRYDGYPLFPSLHVSARPFTVHPDREALAAGLTFHHSVAGSLKLGRGCSPQLGSALRAFFAPIDVHVLSLDFEPSRIVGGTTTLHLLAEGVNEEAAPHAHGNDVTFKVSREGAGSVATAREMGVVSNAALLPFAEEPPLRRIMPALGVAVLFAEDLFAGNIAFPGLEGLAGSSDWARLSTLLDAAGLKLVTA